MRAAACTLAAWAVTCCVATAAGQSHTVRDSARIYIVENHLPPRGPSAYMQVASTPILVLGGPGAKGNLALGGVSGAARLSDGRVAISDFNKMHVAIFDSVGKLRARIDNVGVNGRLEPPWGLVHAGADTLLLWDGWSNQLSTIDRRGNVRHVAHIDNPPNRRFATGGSSRVAMRVVGVLPAGQRLGSSKYAEGMADEGIEADSGAVYRIDAKGKLVDLGRVLREERFRFNGKNDAPGRKTGADGPLPFGRTGSIAVGGVAWFYADGSAFEIQRRSPFGEVEAIIRLDRSRGPVTAEDKRRFSVARLERLEPYFRPGYQLALAWMKFPSTKPAYTDLNVDRAGNLWARLWANDDEVAQWDVFDPVGAYKGVVGIPPDLAVLEIGRDYLLAKYTRDYDAWDKSEIRVYRLTPHP